MKSTESVALRVQRLDLQTQALVLAHISAGRTESRSVTAASVVQLFLEFALPAPARISNVFASLTTKKLLTRAGGRGEYQVTPEGRLRVQSVVSDMDAQALTAESGHAKAPSLGSTALGLVPPTLAPPALLEPLRRFLADHPFETNVFGMTRFPSAKAGVSDPVERALAIAKEVCSDHGLTFHLASDRAISDDLWTNVTAHMWASKYGIALFEDRVDRGLNHNLLIEVGAMVMTGRRCALLKDGSIEKMPTDFVGMIYKSVDLGHEASVADAVAGWIKDDLRV